MAACELCNSSGGELIWQDDLCRVVRVDDADRELAYRAKYLLAEAIPRRCERVMFLDCDCLVLKNPESYLQKTSGVLYAEEHWSPITGSQNHAYLTDQEMKSLNRRAVNSGVFAMSREELDVFAKRWAEWDRASPEREKICYDQPAFVRTLLDWEGAQQAFDEEAFRVAYPECDWMRIQDFLKAGVLHFCGISTEQKLGRMLGYYLMLHGESLTPFLMEMLQG